MAAVKKRLVGFLRVMLQIHEVHSLEFDKIFSAQKLSTSNDGPVLLLLLILPRLRLLLLPLTATSTITTTIDDYYY